MIALDVHEHVGGDVGPFRVPLDGDGLRADAREDVAGDGDIRRPLDHQAAGLAVVGLSALPLGPVVLSQKLLPVTVIRPLSGQSPGRAA